MIRIAFFSLVILAVTQSAAPPKYIAVMFYKPTDAACRRDIWKIRLSGNESKLQYVDIGERPELAKQHKITRVPTYIIWERQGSEQDRPFRGYKEVFRTHDLNELDRVTRGRR